METVGKYAAYISDIPKIKQEEGGKDDFGEESDKGPIKVEKLPPKAGQGRTVLGPYLFILKWKLTHSLPQQEPLE